MVPLFPCPARRGVKIGSKVKGHTSADLLIEKLHQIESFVVDYSKGSDDVVDQPRGADQYGSIDDDDAIG